MFHCAPLRSAVLNEGLESLRWCHHAHYAFDPMEKSVVLPSTLRALEDRAFKDCEKLSRVEFCEGSRLERIEKYAFYCCSSLRSICLPEGLKCIGERCFFRSGVEEITIPSSVTTIEGEAFLECEHLSRVTF